MGLAPVFPLEIMKGVDRVVYNPNQCEPVDILCYF